MASIARLALFSALALIGQAIVTTYSEAMQVAGGGESNAFAAAASDASVNFSTGGATVSVPIVIPQGRMLTTPSLALTYSHHAGLSFAGMGWSLPIGAISRQTKHGMPRCDAPIMNEFEMVLSDSSNELVQATPQDPDRYVQKIDEAWSEAIADRSSNSWTVHTHAGLKYTFGDTVASRVISGPTDTFHETGENCTSFTTAWYSTKVADTNGNVLSIEYEKYGNTPFPRYIRYGGTENEAGTQLIREHLYEVEIVPEEIEDKPLMRSFASGADQTLERRIKEIVVRHRTKTNPTGSFVSEVRRYTLTYDDSLPTQEFLLTSVSATDLPTRTFRYVKQTATVVDATSGVLPDSTTLETNRNLGPTKLFMDFNADGLLDRVRAKQDDPNRLWEIMFGTTHQNFVPGVSLEFGYSDDNGPLGAPSGYNGNQISRDGDAQGGDFDVHTTIDLTGDGIPDFVARVDSQYLSQIRVYQGNCGLHFRCGFYGAPMYWNNPGPSNNEPLRKTVLHGGDNNSRSVKNDLIDMNGDGRPDIVRADSSGDWSIYLNTGSGFAEAPVVYSNIDNAISYSRQAEQTGAPETALIDVNSDGLPDRVVASQSMVAHLVGGSQDRVPRRYFLVDITGFADGPFEVDVSGPLCHVTGIGAGICAGSSLPAGGAIVPAVAVQMNNGRGFEQAVYSPAPWWKASNKDRVDRLRAMRVDNGGDHTRVLRDFVDVNGDGRVDWVATGQEYANVPEENWYVMLNLGDGHFGGPLTHVTSASAISNQLVSIGSVRPGTVIQNVHRFLGQTFAHANPSRSDTQIIVMDIDGDGIVEHVSSLQTSSSEPWQMRKLHFLEDSSNNSISHTKPLLLVGMSDGVGGETEFRYTPSSDFAAIDDGQFLPTGEPDASGGMPFSQWVVSAIRRTDGLCDTPVANWFTDNLCLTSGHELVQSISYRDAKYDGVARELRGFREVTIRNAPMPTGGAKRLTYFQDEFTKGKLKSEELLVGESTVLSKTEYVWLTAANGPRTQIYVGEQRVEEYPVFTSGTPSVDAPATQCTIHRNSIYSGNDPDPKTRVQTSCSMACVPAAGSYEGACAPIVPGKKQIEMEYVTPSGSHAVWDRPARMVFTYVDSTNSVSKTSETEYYYDGLPIGSADRGRLTLKKTRLSDSGPEDEKWAYEYTTYDGGAAEGPGNITSVRIPRHPTDSRGNHDFSYDNAFGIFPEVERLPGTFVGGTPVTHEIHREFDEKTGKMIEQTGLVGDVSGAEYDSLGRPTCEYSPGTSCSGSGFTATATYAYHFGDPGSPAFADRLSWAEVKRREPNAPGGYLVSRTYTDALGRERFTTNQQLNSATNQIQTVVARQILYGTNGKPTIIFEPYWGGSVPTGLNPPVGAAFESNSYVLNGNSQGYLDPAGRIYEKTLVNGGVPKTYFQGNTVTTRSADNRRTTSSTLDAHGRVVLRQSVGVSSAYSDRMDAVYDGADNVLLQWFGGDTGTTVVKAYDLAGRMIARTDPDSGAWTRKYDWVGNVLFENDPKANQSVQSCYDQQDRPLLQCGRSSDTYDEGLCSAASPACTRHHTYKYDEAPLAKGKLTTATNTWTTIKYAYDVRGRVISRQDIYIGSTKTTTFEYRPDIDRLTKMTYPDGEIVSTAYDVAGQPNRLSRVNSSDAWLEWYVMDVQYDIRGKPIYIERGNYTTDTLTYHDASEGYALATARSERVSSGGANDPGEVFFNLAYNSYDLSGRLESITDFKWTTGPLSMTGTYQYDAGGRLTEAAVTGQGPESFEYDNIGNITSKNGLDFGYGQSTKPHQATSLGPVASPTWEMTYDDNGQRDTKSSGSVSQTYGYDAFGNLHQISVNGATTSFGYDHNGQRVFETGGGSTRFFYGKHSEGISSSQLLVKYYYLGDLAVATKADSVPWLFGAGSAPVAPLSIPPALYWSTMSVAMLLLFLPLSDKRQRWTGGASPSAAFGAVLVLLTIGLPLGFGTGCTGSAATRHLHMGHLGGPLAVSKVGGDPDRHYRYSAYGEVRRYDRYGAVVAIDNENRREYTSYETDNASGLQYAGLRYYDPTLATFTSHDPVEVVSNPYAYVGWDPINRIDPNGTEPISVALAIIATLAVLLAVAQAVYAAALTGSAGTFFGSLALSLSGVGTVMGIVRQPSTIAFAVPIVGGIAAGIYGVSTAETTADAVFAGVGLAIAVASAAVAVYAASSQASATPEGTLGDVSDLSEGEIIDLDSKTPAQRTAELNAAIEANRKSGLPQSFDIRADGMIAVAELGNDVSIESPFLVESARAAQELADSLGPNWGVLRGAKHNDGSARLYGGALVPDRNILGTIKSTGSAGMGARFTVWHEYAHSIGHKSEQAANDYASRRLGLR